VPFFTWWRRLMILCKKNCMIKVTGFRQWNLLTKFLLVLKCFARSIFMNTGTKVEGSMPSWKPSKRWKRYVIYIWFWFVVFSLCFFLSVVLFYFVAAWKENCFWCGGREEDLIDEAAASSYCFFRKYLICIFVDTIKYFYVCICVDIFM
jgi:hypothetical protein